MLGRKKTLKIEFVSEIKGVAEMFPVLEASKYKRKWIDTAVADYKKTRKDNEKQSYLVRCPGIFSLFRKGYILTACHDFCITTKKGEKGFSWKFPDTKLEEFYKGKPPIEGQAAKFFLTRNEEMETLVKINTPYHFIAPKGIKLLVLPVPYPEQFDFESSMGILDPEESTELNVQLHWYKKDGEVVIKAGTPLAYLMPLLDSERKIEINNRYANEKEFDFLNQIDYIHALTFTPYKHMKKIKKLYKRFFLD